MSGSKSARNQSSIVARQNVCGGPKKAGLGPSVGVTAAVAFALNIRAAQTIPKVCVPRNNHPTQRYGYRATLGPM